ncbi:MAG TPA: tetratricopeptide repeat protein [Nitrolancea sp.]|nr:tetratricopeptide repeat protein [Nitrolancea sp.]
MSGRAGRPSSSGRKRKRGIALPLITALGIGTLLFALLVAVLPTGGNGDNNTDSNDANTTVQVTPGAEEADMRARLDKNPNDVDAMVILADLLANSGRGTESIQWYDKAVQARPDDVSLRIAFGTVLMQYSYDLDAKLQFQKAHDLNPKDPQPLYMLGQLFEHQQQPDLAQARDMYTQAQAADPGSVYAELAKNRLADLDATPTASPSATP